MSVYEIKYSDKLGAFVATIERVTFKGTTQREVQLYLDTYQLGMSTPGYKIYQDVWKRDTTVRFEVWSSTYARHVLWKSGSVEIGVRVRFI